jgi:hypothetical protein
MNVVFRYVITYTGFLKVGLSPLDRGNSRPTDIKLSVVYDNTRNIRGIIGTVQEIPFTSALLGLYAPERSNEQRFIQERSGK